ncbi:leucyl aminopeptidase [Falsarthrobacter nasiphocae]|uniref:Probable cytosol aminopeptidase n=1 Tax=Falsarthrobacter nasiphocae TaxID=189863 RepID=A0AAE3YDA2_9MICC|nr:leucyl aminopeptidase [Falsarthrobacter nasiphocae]MDR6891284.1 leucyl aminopeptidase [Falsarthrobacter nasiphocae]
MAVALDELLALDLPTASASSTLDGAGVIVLFAASADSAASIVDSSLAESDLADLTRALGQVGFTGEKDAVARLPRVSGDLDTPVVVVGLGKLADGQATTQVLRHAAGTAVRAVKDVARLTFDVAGFDAGLGQALLEGAVLGSYRYTGYKSSASPRSLTEVVWHASDVPADEAEAAAHRAQTVARGVAETRSLVNTSALQLFPESFADAAVAAAKEAGVKATVLDDTELAEKGYGGLTFVGMGSSRGPRLVRLEYAPKSSQGKVAFVGKGITFDTGGISIKPAANMHEMKSDMAGAATVLATVLTAARLELDVTVIGYLALAENMPSATAGRPGDIITMFGGKTVEVLNTDAEGRLVMGDALAAASLDEPDAIVDIATLTSAALVALGKRTAGVMGDDDVADALLDAADAVDEPLWEMPIPEEMRGTLDSTQADLANIGQREGGMLIAAAFLREFVGETEGERIPWAHVDIAGPSFNAGSPYGHVTKEGTGYGVRTLVAYLEGLSA